MPCGLDAGQRTSCERLLGRLVRLKAVIVRSDGLTGRLLDQLVFLARVARSLFRDVLRWRLYIGPDYKG